MTASRRPHPPFHIRISVSDQTLTLYALDESAAQTDDRWSVKPQGKVLMQCSISSSKNGVGQERGSYQTPQGRHYIRAKIGAGAPANTVFVGRRPTGEVWSPELAEKFPDRDWILTRICWLCGLEPGKNRLGHVDTMRRYVYLHGSPDTVQMGEPGSIGCIRMHNHDIQALFDQIPAGTTVLIE